MTSHDAYTSGTSKVSHSSIITAVEDGGSYSNNRRLWGAVYYKVFQCIEHSADRNSSSAVPVLWLHTARRQHISCRSSARRCLIIIHPISRTSRPVISFFSYTLRNSRPVSVTVFKMIERRRWVSQWFQSQAADFYGTGYKSWSHDLINFSIPEMIMLKNSSKLAASFQ